MCICKQHIVYVDWTVTYWLALSVFLQCWFFCASFKSVSLDYLRCNVALHIDMGDRPGEPTDFNELKACL